VLTTAKHFPGHGDTATDSHIGLAVVESDMARLQAVEFAPFRSAIEAGVDSIMTAHVAVPQVTNESGVPATLSSKILTDVLRNNLKFDGIIVTDALEMGGVTNHYWCGLAAIRAIQAGADVLLLPPNATVAINEVERAVRRGDIPESRIDQSVRKVLNAKYSLGLQQNRLVPLERVGEIVASPENVKLAQEIADHSITAAKDEHHLLPVNPLSDKKIFSLVLSPGLDSSPGSIFQDEMHRRFSSIRTAWANARIPDELLATIDKTIADSDLIVVSTFVRLASGTDALSFPASQRRILRRLTDSRKPVIWVAFGNPYVLRIAPKIGTYVCTFSYSDVSQAAAAKALAGEIEVAGKMPVSVPPYSKMGDGLRIPELEMTLRPEAPEMLGLPKNSFEDTKRLLTSFVESHVFDGVDLLVGYQNRIAAEFAVDSEGSTADSAGISSGKIYDLNSLSGIVGTASGVMLASDSGSLILEAPVRDYTPELITPDTENLNVWGLLTTLYHEEKPDTPQAARQEALLREIVSRTAGIPFERFLTDGLLEPLGMERTYLKPNNNPKESMRHVESSESASLFCSAHDLAVFSQMLLNEGLYDHRRILKASTIAKFTGSGGPWTKPNSRDWSGRILSPSAYGYSAPTGSFLWIDPARKLFLVFLTNGSQQNERIRTAQRKIAESVIAAIQH
jgi:beta-N-acetylhexosaminidase